VNDRILEAFDTFNALNVSDRLSKCIHFERRRPQGTENLFGLLHAIRNQVRIKFTYQKFWEDEASSRFIEPYALKEFRNRWYVIGKDLNDEQVKSYGLDRLTNLEITRKAFAYPLDFDVEEKYRFCFGIISSDDNKPKEIILSFDPFQGKYIKTMPLHETQEILVDTDDELRIRLMLFITHDLVMELLSYGDSMKVIQPQELVEQIRSAHYQAFSRY
jgi:predicted DNA-binding transcriptional regulator YafY